MTDDILHKEGNKLINALPIYLAVQGITLLLTFLDFPVYAEAGLSSHTMTVGGWVGLWFMLVVFGLSIGMILLISNTWKMVFSDKVRGKLAAGYFLGAIAGLVTLGIRFMPIMPKQYFIIIAGIILFSFIIYFVWIKRQSQFDEIFP
jgi:hypothetical protein